MNRAQFPPKSAASIRGQVGLEGDAVIVQSPVEDWAAQGRASTSPRWMKVERATSFQAHDQAASDLRQFGARLIGP